MTTPSLPSSMQSEATIAPTGYLSRSYAEALGEWGEPLQLQNAGGYILKRAISGTTSHDAMGCYPLFSCQQWSALARDFDLLREELVSVALVTDPFGHFDESLLRSAFDRAVPFKNHFVANLEKPVNELANWHHRKHARRALQESAIDIPEDPVSVLDDWMAAYGTLINRHGIAGLRAFSRRSFQIQLQVPGVVAIRARHVTTGDLLGIQLWYLQGDIVYSHLSAYTELGYRKRVAYALNWTANEHFAGLARWLHLGAGAGTGNGTGGLVDYKQGWSTDTKPVWFCGKILQPDRYASICGALGTAETAYFPAYRNGEF